MNKFDCPQVYKWDKNIREQLRENVEEYVLEYYDVTGIDDLTEQQIDEIQHFVDLPENQFSLVCDSLSDIIEWWEPPEQS